MSTWDVSVSEVEGVANTLLGRPSTVLTALRKILSRMLLPTLQQFGTNLFPERSWPRGFHLASEYLGDLNRREMWPRIIIGGSFSTQDWGMGHADNDTVPITCAFGPQISADDVLLALDVATVVRAILRHHNFAGPFRDPDDATRLIWNHLLPTGFRMVPSDWPHYQGWSAMFQIVQVPQSNLW